jgi:hypothetical protein
MQVLGNSQLFGAGQLQRLLGGGGAPLAYSAGNSSPPGEIGAAPGGASPRPDQAAGAQFAAHTLASLLSVQQQPPAAGDLAGAPIRPGDANGADKPSADKLAAGFQTLAKAHAGHHRHHGASSADLAQKLVSAGDANGDGELGADEILAELPSQASGLGADAVKTAIAKLDTDGDGKLSGAELAAAIDALRHPQPTTAAAAPVTSQA